jgi:hypothetical protein
MASEDRRELTVSAANIKDAGAREGAQQAERSVCLHTQKPCPNLASKTLGVAI